MKTQATPRPWKLFGDGKTIINVASGEVLGIRTWCADSDYHIRAKANAELIVKAVNRDHLFDELLIMLEDLGNGIGLDFYKTADAMKFQDLLQRAKAAK